MTPQPLLIPVSLDGVELYQLVKDFPYLVHGTTETAREGYILDGASVPRPLWPLLPRDGTHRAEALKHDWGYDCRGHYDNGLVLTKHDVDWEFLLGLRKLGTLKPWKCDVIYEAVNIFGQKAWDEGDGTHLILPVGSLAPAIHRPRKKLFRHIYQAP